MLIIIVTKDEEKLNPGPNTNKLSLERKTEDKHVEWYSENVKTTKIEEFVQLPIFNYCGL